MLQNEPISGRLRVCFVFIFHQLIPGEVKIHTPGKRTELGRLEAKPWCQIKTFLLPTEPVISGWNADTGYSLLDNLAGFLPLSWLPGFLSGVSGTSTGQLLSDLPQLLLILSLSGCSKQERQVRNSSAFPAIPPLQEECPTAEFRSGEGSLDKCSGRLKFPGFDIAVAGVISARFACLINNRDTNSAENSNWRAGTKL